VYAGAIGAALLAHERLRKLAEQKTPEIVGTIPGTGN
jgi:hypothetical protein